MISKICFITPTPEYTLHYEKTLATLSEPPPIFECTLDEAEKTAMETIKQGYDILVTPEHYARQLWGKVDTPIIAMSPTPIDIAQAIHHAAKVYGEPVALFRFQSPNSSSPALQEIMKYHFSEFVFHEKHDGLLKLKEVIREGYHAVIGPSVIIRMARKAGIPCAPLLPSPEEILKTLQQALQIASVRQTEKRQEMKFKHVVQYSFNGIIVTDHENKIVVFNSAAEQIFKIQVDHVLGRLLERVIPRELLPRVDEKEFPQIEELITLQDKQLLYNRIPIVEEGTVLGTTFTFQEVSNIQFLEEKIRRAGHVKGLSAKLSFQDIVGNSKVTQDTIDRAHRFARTDETILITGESGTGKEVFAQSIHNASTRHAHPFLAVNCSAISPSLLESELFGYAEGAFTGARKGGKQGLFELAHRGTIFLDEIGGLSLEAQGHLLRVLQEKEVMRVGDAKITPVNVRVIAAANRPLKKSLEQGVFRLDLYQRLNVLRLSLPPLRERTEDILSLANSFVSQWCLNQHLANNIKKYLLKYIELLKSYSWPGNVRELQNLIKRLLALSDTITDKSIEQEIKEHFNETLDNTSIFFQDVFALPKKNTKIANATNELIYQQYKQWHGNKEAFAKNLGISRTTLWRKLKK